MAALNGAVGRWRSRARSVSHADRSARALVGAQFTTLLPPSRDDSWEPLLNLVKGLAKSPTRENPCLTTSAREPLWRALAFEWRAVVGEKSQPI